MPGYDMMRRTGVVRLPSAEKRRAHMERLEAFEKMLADLQAQYAGVLEKMEELRAQGKEKTVTYRQLMANKLRVQELLSMYEIYGLVEKG